MPLRFRKSFTIMPGLRLNINKKSVSLTTKVGPVSHTVSTSGRDTTNVSLPGPLSYRKETTRRKIAERRANIRQLREERRNR